MNGTQMKPAFCSQSWVALPPTVALCGSPPSAAEHAGRDHQRDDELHHADAEIAEAGIERERIALFRPREEEADIGHRGGEVAAAEAAQQRQHQEEQVGRGRILHRKSDADRRDQQRRGRQRRPQPAAEDRRHERIEDAQRRARQAGHGRQPEQLIGVELEADRRQLGDHHRPHHPHREGQQQGRYRDPEIAVGDALAGRFPEFAVVNVPSLYGWHLIIPL